MYTYSRQKISKKDVKNVVKQINSGYLTQGSKTKEFEEKLKNICGSKYCLVVNSATSALINVFQSLSLKKNDMVWTTSNTFVSTVNSIKINNFKHQLVDINLDDFNLDLIKLEKKLKESKIKNKLPQAIVIVHFGGAPENLAKIFELKKKYNFKIVEDASHALGSKYKNNMIGSCKYTDACIFSFHPVKTITSAEGGAILTNNHDLYQKAKCLRTHGIIDSKSLPSKEPWLYDQKYLGYNFRMSEIHAALGLSQLNNLDKFISRRNYLMDIYFNLLKDVPLKFQKIRRGDLSSYHLNCILIDMNNLKMTKMEMYNYFLKKRIRLQVHYIPIYNHSYYKRQFNKNEFPNNNLYYQNTFSFPLYYDLKKQDIKYISNQIKNFLDKYYI